MPFLGIPPIMPKLHSRLNNYISCLNYFYPTILKPSWQLTKANIFFSGTAFFGFIWDLITMLFLYYKKLFNLGSWYEALIIDSMGFYYFYTVRVQFAQRILLFEQMHKVLFILLYTSAINIVEFLKFINYKSSEPLIGSFEWRSVRTWQIWWVVNHLP